jgi:glucose-1-phosphate thymidylyltransferase
MNIVGVVPAAGSATRLQPLRCSKEVYPINGRPVMDYLVERMRAADYASLRVVTTPEKRDVIEHAEQLGAEVIEGRPASVSASLLLGLTGGAREDVVLFGFPDTIWEPPAGFRTLLANLADDHEVALGVFHSKEPQRSDVVSVDETGTVGSVQVKADRPTPNLIWGCGVARVQVLEGLVDYEEPGHYFDALARRGRVRGIYLGRRFLDIGTRESLLRAERGEW